MCSNCALEEHLEGSAWSKHLPGSNGRMLHLGQLAISFKEMNSIASENIST
jgi:hypothetical protein